MDDGRARSAPRRVPGSISSDARQLRQRRLGAAGCGRSSRPSPSQRGHVVGAGRRARAGSPDSASAAQSGIGQQVGELDAQQRVRRVALHGLAEHLNSLVLPPAREDQPRLQRDRRVEPRVERQCGFLLRQGARPIAQPQMSQRHPVMRIGAARHGSQVSPERVDRLPVLPRGEGGTPQQQLGRTRCRDPSPAPRARDVRPRPTSPLTARDCPRPAARRATPSASDRAAFGPVPTSSARPRSGSRAMPGVPAPRR